MDPKAKRTAIAAALQSGLPTGWAVFPAPPDSIPSQCAVISPRSPYVQRVAGGTYEVNLQIALLVNLAAGPVALDILDDAIAALENDIFGVESVVWESVSEMAVVNEVGGAEYLAATINITVL